MESITFELNNIDAAAQQFASKIGDNTLFAFYGSMGAGKTTFITALCHELGVKEDMVNSPTFSLVNIYETDKGENIYHFDFYRLKNPQEAIDFGLYDYFDTNDLCLMEWPENIEEILPDDCIKVNINVNEDNSRTITW